MPAWTPETWGDFSVVGIVVFVAFLLVVGLTRGWIVIGKYHREVVDGKDRVIDKLEARGEKDADTIHTLTQGLMEKNATEDASTRILAAFREAAAAAGGAQ